jgi:hypothetical protein
LTDAPIPPPPAATPGWRVFAESVRGTAHRRAGEPGQDEHHWQVDDAGRLVAAVADGAGSTRLGGVAAQIAARVAVESVIQALGGGNIDGRTILERAFAAAGTALAAAAVTRGCAIDDLSTTLIVMLATPDLCGVAQIGDGFALAVGPDGEVLGHSLPQGGEYANDTVFLDGDGAASRPTVTLWRGPVAAVAVLSDGLQRLALQLPQQLPHRPFFDSIFRYGERDPQEAQRQLSDLLNSARVAEKTDDDLTMVVGWHRGRRR